ncbi:MAG TPA: serine/threonine-protein kinase [Burkholderiales bacterium]
MAVDALFLSFQEAVAGRYSLERELGRGGMGVVYLAREVRLDRSVAIKILPPEFAAQPELRERFLREARMAARLSHPNIVPIHSVDEVGQFVFYVMTYVDGDTLSQRVASSGPMSPATVMKVLREVAWALAYAHAQGLVHRDVKPANILLEKGSERAMVTDFGIARQTQASGQTAVGELLGTPEYMSPEQSAGEPVDGRSDLYSLGIVGYFALTGTLPFTGSTQAVLAQQITKSAPSVASVARGAPRALCDALDKCLAKNPADRFGTGEALADAMVPGQLVQTELPVPLRVFTDRRRNVAIIAPLAALSSAALSVGIGRAGGAIAAFALLGSAVVLPVLFMLNRMRALAKHGYGAEDVAAALRTRYERSREEFLFEYGAKPRMIERGLLLGGRALLWTALASAIVIASGRVLGGPSAIPAWYAHFLGRWSGFLAGLATVGIYGGVFASALGGRWRRLRSSKGPVMARFWESAVGRWFGRVAKWKLRDRAIAAERATELKIAMSAEMLFESLPKPLRESLGDVPEVLRTLQNRAHAAREQIAKLDAVMSGSSDSGGRAADKRDALASDVRRARSGAEERLSELVTALETVRLDLLRLQAGIGSPDSITQDLAAAAAVGQDADRLIAALSEADSAARKR